MRVTVADENGKGFPVQVTFHAKDAKDLEAIHDMIVISKISPKPNNLFGDLFRRGYGEDLGAEHDGVYELEVREGFNK